MNRVIVSLLAALVLPGACAQRESAMAEDGQQRLIGLRSDDLRLCAGVPDRTATSDGGDFWTYDRAPPATGLSVPVPLMGGSVNLSGANYCRVTFQMVDQRVTRIAFQADNDVPGARNSACAPVLRGCLRLVEQGTIRVR